MFHVFLYNIKGNKRLQEMMETMVTERNGKVYAMDERCVFDEILSVKISVASV